MTRCELVLGKKNKSGYILILIRTVPHIYQKKKECTH